MQCKDHETHESPRNSCQNQIVFRNHIILLKNNENYGNRKIQQKSIKSLKLYHPTRELRKSLKSENVMVESRKS